MKSSSFTKFIVKHLCRSLFFSLFSLFFILRRYTMFIWKFIVVLINNMFINSDTSVFLLILQNFLEHSFCRTFPVTTSARSSHQRCSIKKGVLRNFLHRCFPENFAKFLRTLFYRTPAGDCFCSVLFCFVLLKFLHSGFWAGR